MYPTFCLGNTSSSWSASKLKHKEEHGNLSLHWSHIVQSALCPLRLWNKLLFITKLSTFGDQIEPKSTKADYRPIKSNCRFTILNYRPTESVYVCIKSGMKCSPLSTINLNETWCLQFPPRVSLCKYCKMQVMCFDCWNVAECQR